MENIENCQLMGVIPTPIDTHQKVCICKLNAIESQQAFI
jgi:hypothetical protein